MRLKYKIFFLFLLSLFLTACFHLQSAKNFPPELKTLSFVTDNVYNEISVDLKRKLRAMKVKLNTVPGPLTLTLKNSKTSTYIPAAFNTLIGTVYRYEMRVKVELNYTKDGKSFPLIQTNCIVTQDVTHNANQVSAASFPPLMRRTLTQKLVNSIYYLLISQNTQNQIKALQTTAPLKQTMASP